MCSRCASCSGDSVSTRGSDNEVDTDRLIKSDQDEGAAMNIKRSALQRPAFA